MRSLLDHNTDGAGLEIEFEYRDADGTVQRQVSQVTEGNKARLVHDKINSLVILKVEEEFAALRQGLFDAIPEAALRRCLNAQALFRLVRGEPQIDVEDLLTHTDLSGIQSDADIQWLQEILRGLRNWMRSSGMEP